MLVFRGVIILTEFPYTSGLFRLCIRERLLFCRWFLSNHVPPKMQHLGPERQVNSPPGKTPGVRAWMPVTTMRVFEKNGPNAATKTKGKGWKGQEVVEVCYRKLCCFFFGWAIFWSKFGKSRKSKQKGGRFKKASSNSKRSKKVEMKVCGHARMYLCF